MILKHQLQGLLAGSLVVMLAAGCGALAGDAATVPPPSSSPTAEANIGASGSTCPAVTGSDHLARVCRAGALVVSTDPAYPPQSALNEETGEFEGFDIDVAAEIASRLGLEIRFETPLFEDVDAGDWSGRWDVSVGSVTVTEDRKGRLDFTRPYYFTPAQLAVRMGSDIDSVRELAGETICVAEATTYAAWLDGSLQLAEEAGRMSDPPAGVEVTTLPTDLDCAESWRSGLGTFAGWLSSITTVDAAVDPREAARDLVDRAVEVVDPGLELSLIHI